MNVRRGAQLTAGRRRGRLVQRPVRQPVRDRGVGRRGGGAARAPRAPHGRVTSARGRRAAAARGAARPLTD